MTHPRNPALAQLDVLVGRGKGMRWWGNRPNPPANSVILVPGFTPLDFLWGLTPSPSFRNKHVDFTAPCSTY